MKYLRIILFMSVLLFYMASITALGYSPNGAAKGITVFGPEKFERLSGKPVTVTKTFTIPGGVSGFTMRIQSGDSEGNQRVTSG